ncbi:MAG: hypothetical protein J2P36_21480 [Ktedonobacteraceae bacterium]|nr:hypothetical protein [Ktedonobacteraceae bacterium]
MHDIAPEIVSIADACLGGLRGRSALLIGSEEGRAPYVQLLGQAHMQCIYEEETPERLSSLLPNIQLLISVPDRYQSVPTITAANIARGSMGRHTPLLIFDLAIPASVEELAGLLPAVCLYTSNDLRSILARKEMKAS